MRQRSVQIVTKSSSRGGSAGADEATPLFDLDEDFVRDPPDDRAGRGRGEQRRRGGGTGGTGQGRPKRDAGGRPLRSGAEIRDVSLFWTEKIMCLADHLQVFAILWSSAQAWPWPFQYVSYTRWVLAFNVDVVGWMTYDITKPGAPARSIPVPAWGLWESESVSYVYYAGAFAGVPLLILLMFLLGMRWRSPMLRALAFRSAEFCYVPVALAVLRLGYCAPDGVHEGRLSVDPRIVCGTTQHLATLGVTFTIAGAYLVGMPLAMAAQVRHQVVHTHSDDHERRLLWCESEFLLGLSNSWLVHHMSMSSSYRRPHAYHRVWAMLFKLAVVLVFCFARWPLPGASADTDDSGQSPQVIALLCIFLVVAVVHTAVPPYRCRSTNLLLAAAEWPLVVMTFLGWFKASGVRSALVVDSVLSAINFATSGVAAAAMLGSLVWFVGVKKERWPTRLACGSAVRGETSRQRRRRLISLGVPLRGLWFVRMAHRGLSRFWGCLCCPQYGIVVSDTEVGSWLASIRRAQAMLDKCSVTPGLLMPLDKLDETAAELRVQMPRALRQRHVLGLTLRHVLEQIVAMQVSHRDISLQPNPQLSGDNLQRLRERLDEREAARVLAAPSRSGVLFKLLALRSWIGDRDIASSDRIALPDVPRFTVEHVNAATFHVRFRAGPLFLDLRDSGAFDKDPDDNVAGLLRREDVAKAYGRQHQLAVMVHGFTLPTSGKVGPAEACKAIEWGHYVVAVNREPLDGLPFEDALAKIDHAAWPKVLTFARYDVDPSTAQRRPRAGKGRADKGRKGGEPSAGSGDDGAGAAGDADEAKPTAASSSASGGSTVLAASTEVVGKSWEELVAGQQHSTEMAQLLTETWEMCKMADDSETKVDFGKLHEHRARIRDCIHEWELDFKNIHRRRPKRRDKEEIKEWYDCDEAATRVLPLRLRH